MKPTGRTDWVSWIVRGDICANCSRTKPEHIEVKLKKRVRLACPKLPARPRNRAMLRRFDGMAETLQAAGIGQMMTRRRTMKNPETITVCGVQCEHNGSEVDPCYSGDKGGLRVSLWMSERKRWNGYADNMRHRGSEVISGFEASVYGKPSPEACVIAITAAIKSQRAK